MESCRCLFPRDKILMCLSICAAQGPIHRMAQKVDRGGHLWKVREPKVRYTP